MPLSNFIVCTWGWGGGGGEPREDGGKERSGLIGGGGGGCNFYMKNKLKSEIFHKKKFINKNVFLCHN